MEIYLFPESNDFDFLIKDALGTALNQKGRLAHAPASSLEVTDLIALAKQALEEIHEARKIVLVEADEGQSVMRVVTERGFLYSIKLSATLTPARTRPAEMTLQLTPLGSVCGGDYEEMLKATEGESGHSLTVKYRGGPLSLTKPYETSDVYGSSLQLRTLLLRWAEEQRPNRAS